MTAEEKAAELYPVKLVNVTVPSFSFFSDKADANKEVRKVWLNGANWQASQHEWVKCSERLPDRGKWALLSYMYPYLDDQFAYVTIGFLDYEDRWFSNELGGYVENDGREFLQSCKKVTHWMPLPEPPKTEI